MYVRRGPLRHARMLVAINVAAQEHDALVLEPQPDARLEDRGAEVVPVELLAAPPLPDGPPESVA